MFELSKKVVLVTGASMGIGEAFARELAARGARLVLVARGEERLRQLARELPATAMPEVIAADLSVPGAAESLRATLASRGIAIDVLINNAGFATYGAFETLAAERDHAEIMLNVTALVDLTHAFIAQLLHSTNGAIINVASTAAFQPVPYMAVYGASKAFVLSFSEALWAEYRTRGLRVLALCPGATSTAFFDVVGTQEAQVGRMQSPEQVVATALHALERKRSFVVSGLANYLLSGLLPRFVPRSLVARIGERLVRPKGQAVVVST